MVFYAEFPSLCLTPSPLRVGEVRSGFLRRSTFGFSTFLAGVSLVIGYLPVLSFLSRMRPALALMVLVLDRGLLVAFSSRRKLKPSVHFFPVWDEVQQGPNWLLISFRLVTYFIREISNF